ncbi:unnamed protein product [Rotaria magnacalcarata]|uniref:Uncharacterized protein n=1 Tax=Rotaria magnacalcarata TaxID=392030 RepID=A0A816KZ73_9BILA|nr:unnamed protein product [Rotaria magnacalcarata]CAF2084177.1 unnamed protein product [Rotaria magnacalcarata]CAF3919019.1 unnamed protein product [Rotaria magnacalcarata]CAF3999386.1 unnamed protein product [Rotaria magnacalcarata]
MHFKNSQFAFTLRTSGKAGDSSPITSHRHVSLANIATAFLSERKTSSRRQSSNRRKQRLTTKDNQNQDSRLSTNCANTNNPGLGQQLTVQNTDGEITTIFMARTSTANANNKHRTNVVI